MALLPRIMNEILEPLGFYQRQNHRYCPYQLQERSTEGGELNNFLKCRDSRGNFKVNLDVQQFRPNEISVKVVDDFVVVEGKHEDREDSHGHVSRQFVRRYKLPKDIEPDNVTSELSSDGILTILGPKKQPVPLPDIHERIIPITRTQAPAIKLQEAAKLADEGK